MMTDMSYGGARGLEVLSLAECKNLSDEGLSHIVHLKYLSKIILLGCLKIKDEGIKEIA